MFLAIFQVFISIDWVDSLEFRKGYMFLSCAMLYSDQIKAFINTRFCQKRFAISFQKKVSDAMNLKWRSYQLKTAKKCPQDIWVIEGNWNWRGIPHPRLISEWFSTSDPKPWNSISLTPNINKIVYIVYIHYSNCITGAFKITWDGCRKVLL